VLLESLVDSPISGLIVSNTTLTRPVRSRRLAQEEGGLSGRPVRQMMQRAVTQCAGRGIPLVASGGISTGSDVREARSAGADLVQLWTGLIYAGPGLIGEAIAAT
jgi:dihydroorotate dehydrogenase